jgi:hypothetical protein
MLNCEKYIIAQIVEFDLHKLTLFKISLTAAHKSLVWGFHLALLNLPDKNSSRANRLTLPYFAFLTAECQSPYSQADFLFY